MEKRIFDKKLVFKKETVAKLNDNEMDKIKGGGDRWSEYSCLSRRTKVCTADEEPCD